jgi:hypothetical protein
LLVCLALGVGGCDRNAGSTAFEDRRAERAATPADTARGYDIPRLPPDRLVLSGAAAGLDGLLRTVERALAEHDTTRLRSLMVNAREYRDILFPAFPAAHPPINALWDEVWPMHITDAEEGLRLLVRQYGGKRIRILSVGFEKPDQDFVNFTLDETSHVDVEVDGKRVNDVRPFGSVYHVGNQYKVLSYPDD